MLTRRRTLTLAASATRARSARPHRARTGLAQSPGAHHRAVPARRRRDTIARIVGAKLTELWGQQIIVENSGGAGEISHPTRPRARRPTVTRFSLRRLPRHQPVRLFEALLRSRGRLMPVSLVVRFPVVIVAPNSSPAKNFKRFIELAKSSTNPLTYASPGYGTSPHLAAELLEARGRYRADPCPVSRRRAGNPGPDPRPSRLLLQQYRADRAADAAGPVRGIAVTSAKRRRRCRTCRPPRIRACPASTCPAGTPSSRRRARRRDRRQDACRHRDSALRSGARGKLEDLALFVEGSTPTELEDMMKAERAKWEPVIKAAGITIKE